MRVREAEVELEAGDEGVVVDPVCGRALVAAADSTIRLEHNHLTVHFCSEGCRERFEKLAERVRVGEVMRMGALFAPSERVRWGVA